MKTHGVRAGRWPGQRRGGDPARALGPMIVSLKSLSVWAYVLGPWWGACWVLWCTTSSSVPPPLPMRNSPAADRG